MDDDAVETTQSFSADTDICQQLLDRYAHSSAIQHRHLCATAAATRSIIQSSSLPLNPLSYFAASITSLSNSETLDSTALAALTSFLSIVLPLVKRGEITPEKSEAAVLVLVNVAKECMSKLGTSSIRAVVKCVGVLVAEFCNLEDWDSVSFGFEWLAKFSLDKRPKVRKSAQDCLLTVFKSFGSSFVIKQASKLIYSLLKDHMSFAVEMAASKKLGGSKNERLSRPEHQVVLHLLNLIKDVVPYLSVKLRLRILSNLLNILTCQFSAVSRHIFEVMLAIFESSKAEVVVSNAKEILKSLSLYISFNKKNKKNPVDTVLVAVTLIRSALSKLRGSGIDEWTGHLPLVTESLAGLVSSEADVALHASNVFRELIDCYMDINGPLTTERKDVEDKISVKGWATICTSVHHNLSKSNQIPNEHFLSIVAFLFLRLGKLSHMLMKDIVLKLAELMNVATASAPEIEPIKNCIGSAVAAMGPEKLLDLLPISFNSSDFSCSNIWLIPILKENVVGSSLSFFMEHIASLAESFEQLSSEAKNPVTAQDLQSYAHDCWELLPAFCNQPSDTHKSCAALAKLLLPLIKKNSFIVENIAIGLQELINQNKRALDKPGSVYSTKVAKKNMKALALYSKDFVSALSTVFFESPSATRECLKGAIGCLVCICDSSLRKQIFVSSLKEFQLLDDIGQPGEVGPLVGADAKKSLVLDLASCYVDGADNDLVNLVFCLIKDMLQATDENGKMEACQVLCRILEKHSWFCSSQFEVVMDMLTGFKSLANIGLLKARFSCLQALLINEITTNEDEENTKSFLILNEIIVALKDSNEEGRKVAYDALVATSSKLRNSSDDNSAESYHKLFTMFTGYLSDSSPHIKSGVVSALSILVYGDPQICIVMPEIVPSVMELLHSKSIEVIKAVLGFVKVLVSSLEGNDVQHFLSSIMDGILRWSSVSRNHFKTKITVILEILIRKCGTGAVKAHAPEKYREFVHDVVMNRHGKTNSKETGQEISDSSHQKRKRNEEGSVRPWKRRVQNFDNKELQERKGHDDFKKKITGGKKHNGRTNERNVPVAKTKFLKGRVGKM